MTLYESAAGATLPWNSIDAESAMFDALPQQSIDICLMCPHCASHCEHCGDWRTGKRGRPRKPVDLDKLKEMLALKSRNKEMCRVLGVSLTTLNEAKKIILN